MGNAGGLVSMNFSWIFHHFDVEFESDHAYHTAIPYRESTGFLQGIPCVVFPPLHALAVYRV